MPGFAADNCAPELFVQSAVTSLNDKTYDLERFCTDYWAKSQLSMCKAFPWKYARLNGTKFIKVLAVRNGSTAFAVIEFGGILKQLLTMSKENGVWKLSLDLKSVWEDFTTSWIDDQPFRSVQPFDRVAEVSLRKAIDSSNERILSILKLKDVIPMQYFFLNDEKIASDLGLSWPGNILSGGAREGFALFVGTVEQPWSLLQHELVHSYTVFPGEWWHGPGVFRSQLLSEGLATWFQIPLAWNDKPTKETPSQLCDDIQLARSKLMANYSDLFDDTNFRTFDGSSGSTKAGYLIGASLIDGLIYKLGIFEFKELWNSVGLQPTSDLMWAQVSSRVDESDLRRLAINYLTQLSVELKNRTGFACK